MQPLNRGLAAASDRHRYDGRADFGKTRRNSPDDSASMARAAVAVNTVANGPGADAVVSRSLENVAVWVDESGTGGGIDEGAAHSSRGR